MPQHCHIIPLTFTSVWAVLKWGSKNLVHLSWLVTDVRQKTLDLLLDVLMPRSSADWQQAGIIFIPLTCLPRW